MDDELYYRNTNVIEAMGNSSGMQCYWYLVFIILFPLVTGLIIKYIKLTTRVEDV